MFTSDFAGGTFDEALDYLENTSIAAQIELMPDKIISTVEGKKYSRTYMQATDPTLDPTLNVRIGDYWMRTNDGMNWGEVKMYTWQAIKTKTWGELKGYQELYCWDGTQWQPVSEHAAIASMYTRITQTQEMILQEAERAQGRFIAKTTHYQDADSIVTSAESYTDGKLTQYSTTIQTASMIQTTVSTALGDYSTTTQTESMIQTMITSSLGNYYTKMETASLISTTISTSLGNYYTKQETASLISTTISTSLGDYYTKTETASLISTTISSSLGNYYTKNETASLISTTISTSLGSYYTKNETASLISTTISSALGDYYTKTETASLISSTISTSLGNYSTTTQTSSMISAYVSSKAYEQVSGISINSYGVAITGSKYIKLDVSSSNYVHITDSGIDMGGSRVIVDGNPMWARDDIIIMKPNASGTDWWRQSVSYIEAHQKVGQTGAAHDWVLIKPYYDSSIPYTGQLGNGNDDSVIINSFTQTATPERAFGNNSEWYTYQFIIDANNESGTAYTSRTVKVFLSNRPFTFVSANRESEASTQAQYILEWSGTISGNGHTWINVPSPRVGLNLCGESATIYYYVYGLGMGGNIEIEHFYFYAGTTETTSRVPCTVYYYP